MKRLIPLFSVISLVILACNLTPTLTPSTVPTDTLLPSPPPVNTEVPTVSQLPVPSVTATSSAPAANVTCNGLSLYLDPALASSYTCETVPEQTDVMEVFPQYTKLSFTGYPLSDKFFHPYISVFPIQRFTELLPDRVPGQVTSLQALIAGNPPPVQNQSFSGPGLPFLPLWNAGQVFHALYAVVPFGNGGGIRYVTLYAQYFAPINNHDLFYTYQGLTSDGKYWVSAVLPVNHAILPMTGDNPPNGMTWDQFGNAYETYLADIITQLEAQPAGSYVPALPALDALVASISIQP